MHRVVVYVMQEIGFVGRIMINSAMATTGSTKNKVPLLQLLFQEVKS